MIALDGVAARSKPLALSSLTHHFEAGVHAVVGAPTDGGGLLLAVIAGRVRPRTGTVSVEGAAPSAARRRIAYVPLAALVPDALTVREALDAASLIRGEPARDAAARLAVLGVEALAPRLGRTLAPSEARAVLMVEALTSRAVHAILLEEPFVALDARAHAGLPAAVRGRAREGACVIVATSSTRDAAELADAHLVLEKGALSRRADTSDLGAGAGGARVRVVTPDTRSLLAELAREAAVTGVESAGNALVASGADLLSTVAAVGRAVVRSRVEVDDLRPELPTIDEARAPAPRAT
jgi:ABC-2 type transport system ATP-binding protein